MYRGNRECHHQFNWDRGILHGELHKISMALEAKKWCRGFGKMQVLFGLFNRSE